MKHFHSTICILLIASLLLALCACGTSAPEDTTIEETATTPEPTSEPTATAEPLSETILAEMEIFDAIDYENGNLMTEAEFYDILIRVLALHDLELTEYPGENGHFYFNYSNLDGVRLLTVSRSEAELDAEIDAAWTSYYEDLEEYAQKKQALENGETYTAEAETESGSDEAAGPEFDPDKDVLHSDDYVISFVLAAGQSEMDQQVMFLVSAIAWCILNPHYNNTDDAFYYLWRALYTIHGNSEGLSASTIDGIDSSYPFTIPGNATEAWLGTDDAGNYILAVTNCAVYDEIFDITSTMSDMTASIYGG